MMKRPLQQREQKVRDAERGFTLLEMIVASSVFIVVMLIIIGALISLSDASRKARAIRIVTDNLSAAVDSMSRNIRMGSYFHCGCETSAALYAIPRNCLTPMDTEGGGGEVCFAFEGQNGDPSIPDDQIVYRLSGGRIQRSLSGGTVGSFVDLTAPEITITDMRFFSYGTLLTQDQPMVTMVLRGSAGEQSVSTKTDFNIQTTIGARTPNFVAP